ncbi:MAG: hypothetical protein MJ083_03240 [Clostridia bacterium]|nr:hypothetical protein [Clostridia bacterium]
MKNRFWKKLKSQAGETLVETLFAILIATFASILLASSTSTAIELNRQARERDKVNQLCMEKLSTGADVKTVSPATVKVQLMQLDSSTGKLVKKTNGDTEVAAQSVSVTYTGCEVKTNTLGDFSTYELKVVTPG